MADHNVKLNYTKTGQPPPNDATFAADPANNPIRVRPGQTIAFKLGEGPQNGKVRVTFAQKQFFSTAKPHFQQTGRVDDGDGDVRVIVALPPGSRTTYHCELIVDGVIKAQSHENAGGEVVPDV
jgi:hypothetical protein